MCDVPMYDLYKTAIAPMEEHSRYHKQHMGKADFDIRPIVLLVGEYSVGKTTMICNLLDCSYPGANIQESPSTDKFVAVMYGAKERTIPGPLAVADNTMPFRSLERFGPRFQDQFAVVTAQSKRLNDIIFFDTPGIQACMGPRGDRGFDFDEIMGDLADKASLILLMFDSHRLDVSTPFQSCIEGMNRNRRKFRFILNKVSHTSKGLVNSREYLMMQLGRVIPNTSELLQILNISRFEAGPQGGGDESSLYEDLKSLWKDGLSSKLMDLRMRANSVKNHALLLHHLKESMPRLGHLLPGKVEWRMSIVPVPTESLAEVEKRRLLNGLENQLKKAEQKHKTTFAFDEKEITELRVRLESLMDAKFNIDLTKVEDWWREFDRGFHVLSREPRSRSRSRSRSRVRSVLGSVAQVDPSRRAMGPQERTSKP